MRETRSSTVNVPGFRCLCSIQVVITNSQNGIQVGSSGERSDRPGRVDLGLAVDVNCI